MSEKIKWPILDWWWRPHEIQTDSFLNRITLIKNTFKLVKEVKKVNVYGNIVNSRLENTLARMLEMLTQNKSTILEFKAIDLYEPEMAGFAKI